MQNLNATNASKPFPALDSDVTGFQIADTLLHCSTQIGAYLYIKHDSAKESIAICIISAPEHELPLVDLGGFIMTSCIPLETIMTDGSSKKLIAQIIAYWNIETDRVRISYIFSDQVALALIKMADECTGDEVTSDSSLTACILTHFRPCFAESHETESEFTFTCDATIKSLNSENDPTEHTTLH